MSRYFLLFFLSFPAFGADVSTLKTNGDLDAAVKYCVKNFPKGATSSQEGFEECVRSALATYFNAVVKLTWATDPKTPLVAAAAAPTNTPVPTPAIDRAKEEARAKEQFKILVKSVTCQRCHVGLNASQYTLSQMHAVLTTPSHQEHLGPKDQELIRKLGTMVQ